MWINAKKELPPEKTVVLLRRLKSNDEIRKAVYGKWHHQRDGEYESWHLHENFIDYLDDGQYWMLIPELP